MSKDEKRYYWLKFQKDFFDDLKIKKLRNSIAGGDTYLLIFIRLMALSIHNAGIIEYEGIFETIEEELSIKLNEKETDIKVVLEFAISHKMIIKMRDMPNDEYYIPMAAENIGSESDAAVRKREQRKREKETLEAPKKPSVTLSQDSHSEVTERHIEKETDKTKETNIETHTDSNHIDVEIFEGDDLLLEVWLNEYSHNPKVKNPIGYKQHMRKKIKTHDLDVIDAFQQWKQKRLENDKEETKAQLIDEFDYTLLVGMEINGKRISKVKCESNLSTIHIYFQDGSEHATQIKENIYSWYKFKNKEIA